jgi:hypothetical protein
MNTDQKLFETIESVTGFTPLQSDMQEIKNAVKSNLFANFKDWVLHNYYVDDNMFVHNDTGRKYFLFQLIDIYLREP